MVNERPVETIKIDDIANNFTELCIKTCFERVEETLIETKAKGRSVLTTALKLLQFKEIEFTIAEAVSNTPNQLNEPISRRIIDLNEVAEHTSEYDCWIVLYDRVYDVTKFLYEVIISSLAFGYRFFWVIGIERNKSINL